MGTAKIILNSASGKFELDTSLLVDGDLIVTGNISEGGDTVKKTKDWTGALTASVLWTPDSDKKFVITTILINATADCTVTLFDETDSTENRIFKAKMADKQSIVIPFRKPIASATANNELKITTTAAGGQCTIYGYEI